MIISIEEQKPTADDLELREIADLSIAMRKSKDAYLVIKNRHARKPLSLQPLSTLPTYIAEQVCLACERSK